MNPLAKYLGAACVALTLFAALFFTQGAAAHFAAGGTSTAAPEDGGGGAQPLAEFVREVPLPVNDVVYNPADQTLYASVPSTANAPGNSIVPVNPSDGSLGTPIFVGSEPSRLALADDNRTLYVGLNGAFAVRRFDTQTRTAGAQFSLGYDTNGTFSANDLAVAPGDPNVVAVARTFAGAANTGGVAVYDNGVQRPKTGPAHFPGVYHLAFSASASKLYGSAFNQGLKTMTLDASGVTVLPQTTSFLVNQQRIKFAGGRLYSATGQVIDPDSNALLGTFAGVNSFGFAFEVDAANGRAYYIGRANSGEVFLRSFDLNTFVQLGSASINPIQGNPTTLVRWGANGLALRTDANRLYIIQSSLIPSSDPVPTPTAATPTPTPTPAHAEPATFVRTVTLPVGDLAYSARTERLYVSVRPSAGAGGNSVTPVNPETGETGQPIYVGSFPNVLALADDGQTMYVGLDGANSVRRLDVSSQAAGLQFRLGQNNVGGNYTAGGMEVMPGSPATVAVSRLAAGTFGGDASPVLYDDGVARAQNAQVVGPQLAFLSPSALFAGVSPIKRFAVSAGGLAGGESVPTPAVPGSMQAVGGLLYLSNGYVIDPAANAVRGRFVVPFDGHINAVAVDPAARRAFLLTAGIGGTNHKVIRAYDLDTFLHVGSVNVNLVNDGFGGVDTRLVRWGKNGLAFRNATRLYIVQSALVNAAESVPSPTPTPAATPTPAPPYVPTLVTKLDLPANDLVHSQHTQSLYASVPSAAGPERGNTITRIDPEAASVGASAFVGSEPNRLAVSRDGQTLYAHLDGANSIRRFDVPAMTAGQQFALAPQPLEDMEIVPGSPGSLVVVRGVSFDNGTVVFDNGVQRPSVYGPVAGFIDVEFGASASALYGATRYDNGLYKLQLTPNGLADAGTTRGVSLGQAIKFAAGRLYSQYGRVYEPETGALVGAFTGGGTLLAVDPALGRVFFLSNASSGFEITAHDINTFLPLGTVRLAGVTGTPAGFVRWGTNGLAFATVRRPSDSPAVQSNVYLVRTALVSDSAPIPSALQFASASYLPTESGAANNAQTITVTRTGGVSAPASVSYSTSDGTATAGSDYTATSGTLNFAAGELTKTFSVPILDDNVFEGAETFNVALGSPSGAALAPPSTAVVSISDNESPPAITAQSLFMVEGDAGTTAFEMIIRLSHLAAKTVTVNYTTAVNAGASGAATPGADFLAASGALTFQPGEQEKRITLHVVGDTADEGNESFFVSFTNAVNASAFSSGAVTIIDDERPSVQFSAALFAAGEAAGRATATVTRFGPLTAQASVDYSTLDDTRAVRCNDNVNSRGAAFARCDYATTVDTLTFAPGERQKTITVPLVDDAHDEPDEFVRVQLFNPTGVPLGIQVFTDLRIGDDDAAGAQNPLDSHGFFVRQQYLDFLSREPEPGEPWTKVLTDCPNAFNTDAASESAGCDRNIVSSSFFRSLEFQLKGGLVYRFYRATLGRRPSYNEITFDMRRVTGVTPEEVFAKRRLFSERWVQRIDFSGLYAHLTSTQFVNALLDRYGLEAINAPDPAAPEGEARVVLTRLELIDALNAQRLTRAQVVRAFVESREVDAAEFNGAFVAMQYFGYLRRDPDPAGYNAWLSVLNRGDGFRVMIDGFMNSQEYRLRFGQP